MKVAQLVYNENTERYELDGDELHCGDCIEVLICNGLTGAVEWIDTVVEHDGDRYYLVGLIGYQLGGLFARR